MVQTNIIYYHFQLFRVLVVTLVVSESGLSIRLFCDMCLLCYKMSYSPKFITVVVLQWNSGCQSYWLHLRYGIKTDI